MQIAGISLIAVKEITKWLRRWVDRHHDYKTWSRQTQISSEDYKTKVDKDMEQIEAKATEAAI